MIHSIAIENFFSIAERQEVAFSVPVNAPELDCFVCPSLDQSFRLPTAVGIFGPNASGKSTVLRAIIASILFMRRSFFYSDEKQELREFFQPYRQKEWQDKPTKIIIEFDCSLEENSPEVKFRYELHIDHVLNNFDSKSVRYEAMHYAPEGRLISLFKRHKQKFKFSKNLGEFSKNDPRTESIRPNASIVSTLAQLNHQIFRHIEKRMGFMTHNVISFYKYELTYEQILAICEQDNVFLTELNRELSRVDLGLEFMKIEKIQGGLFARFKHVGLDDYIYYKEESHGTQHFIKIFFLLYIVLKNGSFAIIDELDSYLHPALCSELLRWFSDPKRNPKKAQLFFTAQNTVLLDELQKEQVFFTNKPSGKATCLYGARDIKGLRREPSLMKKYLSGELGAVPHIG